MTFRVFLLMAVLLALTVTTTTGAAPSPCQEAKAPLLCETNSLRRSVWKLQAVMSVPRTATSNSDRRQHASRAYREWVRDLWADRLEMVKADYKEWSAIPNRAELLAIARCETGGINGGVPLWTHHNSTYAGALGFRHSTWSYYAPAGFPRPASAASPEQQLFVGQILVNTFHGYSSWPACSVRLGLR